MSNELWDPSYKTTSTRYYEEESNLKYVLSAKELTELAKEVATDCVVRDLANESPQALQEVVQAVLQERGIVVSWCDDE